MRLPSPRRAALLRLKGPGSAVGGGLPVDVLTEGVELNHADLALLAELAKGVTVDRVGRRLDISGRTVRRRLRGICDRIGVATAIEAVAWAARRQLI
jgi:DNA-binding CsgD family transcriptional regulator